MKAAEQCFPVVLFIMLYKAALTFQSVDEILKCGHSNESYCSLLSHGDVYFFCTFSKMKFGETFPVLSRLLLVSPSFASECNQNFLTSLGKQQFQWNKTFYFLTTYSSINQIHDTVKAPLSPRGLI